MASTQSLSVLSLIRGFHVYKGWWTPHNGESLQLQPEPENPKDRNAVSVVKDRRVVGHMPLMLVNTKEGLGLIKHFLAKPGTNGVVNVCGKAVNRGGGLGMEIPCEYIVTGPHKLIERLEKCLDLTENPAVRKAVFQVKMSKRKEVEKGKQQVESLQRTRNLDDKW
ncbi:hypothetical protein ABFA07_017234 [Porites harrisoni]